eukprot:GEMP01003262.1.p1 GENE.GEMP01003262.1~~GEMP01003262.1.p1  ORF type:complete len:940 (+),score=118.89 GEMP01003262.1:459-3278(+)
MLALTGRAELTLIALALSMFLMEGCGCAVVVSAPCNEAIVQGVEFMRGHPIRTEPECQDMAQELDKPFHRPRNISRDLWNFPQRCYLENDALFFAHTRRQPSTIFCTKRVRIPCRKHAARLCRDRIRNIAGLREEQWTPFVGLPRTSGLFSHAKQFVRRTCKTPSCSSQQDKEWCCDQKLTFGTRLSDDESAVLGRSFFAHGYSKKERMPKAPVFKLTKNDQYSSHTATIEMKRKCDVSHEILENRGNEHFSLFSNVSESDSGSGNNANFNLNFMGFSFGMQYESLQTHSKDEVEFIDQADSASKRVVESRQDCISSEVVGTLGARPLFTEIFLSRLNAVQQPMNEQEQANEFGAFVDRFGLHVIVGAQLGGTKSTFRVTSNNIKAEELKKSLQICATQWTTRGANVGADIPEHEVKGKLDYNSVDDKDECEEKQVNGIGLKIQKKDKHVSRQRGTCDICEHPRRRAGEAADMEDLVNVNLTSIISLVRSEWLTPSTWFATYGHYDVDAIHAFFARWQGLETGHTCFTYDYEQNPDAHEIRRGCRETRGAPSASCQLQMCLGAHLRTDTTRLHRPCDASNTCTPNYCCNKVPIRNECATPDTTTPPFKCANDNLCVHYEGQRLCSETDKEKCQCVNGKKWWTEYKTSWERGCPASKGSFVGNEMDEMQKDNWEDCGKWCSESTACVAWSWEEANKACKLKNTIDHVWHEAPNGFSSGLKDCPGETVCAKEFPTAEHLKRADDATSMTRLDRYGRSVTVPETSWGIITSSNLCDIGEECSAYKIETYYSPAKPTSCQYGCLGGRRTCIGECPGNVIFKNMHFSGERVNLKGHDDGDSSAVDPYCKLVHASSGTEIFKNKYKLDDDRPNWGDEKWTKDLSQWNEGDRFKFRCYDADNNADDFIGQTNEMSWLKLTQDRIKVYKKILTKINGPVYLNFIVSC